MKRLFNSPHPEPIPGDHHASIGDHIKASYVHCAVGNNCVSLHMLRRPAQHRGTSTGHRSGPMEESRGSSAASPRMGRGDVARSARLTSTRHAWRRWCGRACGRMYPRQTAHQTWPRAAVLLQPQSLQVSLAPLRCGWGPSPARQVSLAPLTMRVKCHRDRRRGIGATESSAK